MIRRHLLFSVLFIFAITAFATFVIIKHDGTIVRINLDKLPVEQSGESITITGIDVNDIAHIYNKVWDDNDDYERAFKQGYLSSEYYTYDRKKQVTSQEFKAMLRTIIEKLAPDSMDYFNSRITDYEIPISRGIAAGMAFYVARSIGADTNNSRYERSTMDDFWDGLWANMQQLENLLPYFNTPLYGVEPEWDEMIHAALWNAGHVSVFSDKEVVEFDTDTYNWSWDKPFKWEDAVRAITRLYDSFEPEIEYADFNDPRVTTPDPSIITPELIAIASKKEIHDIADMPRIIGFQMGEGNTELAHEDRFGTTGKDIKEYANWGFNAVRYVVSWRYFFDNDLKTNLNIFRSLDEMIAAAMECGFHINLGFCAMPGYGAYWAENIHDDYKRDFDILNIEKRQKCCDIWRAIATRYKDVPNANLSFCTTQDIGCLTESWGEDPTRIYTTDEILGYMDMMIDVIREVTPERFIFYDGLSENLPDKDNRTTDLGLAQYKHMNEKYDNIIIMFNHMDMAYMFYEYNMGDGNLDWAHHSVWIPTYPITIYGGCGWIHDDKKLTMDGCLPKGTAINIYLADSYNANIEIAADGKNLYEEDIPGEISYNVEYPACWGEPFRRSDKKISITLDADAKELTMAANSGFYDWCGIEVILPESYTVERWWKPSGWDVELGLITEEEASRIWYKKPTSTIQIGTAGGDDNSYHITINDDVTFTSGAIFSYSNKELTEKMTSGVSGYFPRWACRFEDVLVTDMAGALNYWDDTMEVFQRYNVDVWISALGLLSEEQLAPYRIVDYEGENFEGHHNFNVKLLRILQKYVDK